MSKSIVCCVCERKGKKFKNITQNLVEKVRHFQPSYDQHWEVHPTAICDSSRKPAQRWSPSPAVCSGWGHRTTSSTSRTSPGKATWTQEARSLEGNQARQFIKSTNKLRGERPTRRLGRRSDIRPSQSSNSWSSSPMWSECVSECNRRQNTRTLSRVSPDAYNSNNMWTQLALIVDYLKVSQSTTMNDQS